MRNFYKSLLLIAAAFTGINAKAQDTLINPHIGVGAYPANILFLDSVITGVDQEIVDLDPTNNSVGFGIWMNPADSLVYAVVDSAVGNTNAPTQRYFYRVNPFTGERTLIYANTRHFTSIEITNTGRIFGLMGNGGTNPGALYEIMLSTQTDSVVLATTPLTGTTSQPRALGFNPTNNSLYIFSSFMDSVFVYNINTWTLTRMESILTGEQHGAYYENGNFYIGAYSGDVYSINATTMIEDSLVEFADNSVMDLTRFHMIKTHASSFCSNSSMMLVAMYQSPAGYTWYKDGAPIANSNNDTLVVTQAGTYELLEQTLDSTGFIFSAPAVITTLASPVVTITGTADTLCTGDVVTLTATSGGTGQWYLNGSAISGATNSTLAVTDSGSYNYIKTNLNGCSDSSATAFVIEAGTNCSGVSVAEVSKAAISIYPNPASANVNVTAATQISSVVISDEHGRVVMNVACGSSTATISTEALSNGVYFMQVITAEGSSFHKLLKN
jgi:hypothetical protein